MFLLFPNLAFANYDKIMELKQDYKETFESIKWEKKNLEELRKKKRLEALHLIAEKTREKMFMKEDLTKEQKKEVYPRLMPLAECVSVAETGRCTTGMSQTKNNCHGIMTWRRGFREGVYFENYYQSHIAFINLWEKRYGGNMYPTIEQARRYTGNDKPTRWYNTVTSCLNSK